MYIVYKSDALMCEFYFCKSLVKHWSHCTIHMYITMLEIVEHVK